MLATVVICLAHSFIEKEACVAELNRLREMDKERSQKHDQKMKGQPRPFMADQTAYYVTFHRLFEEGSTELGQGGLKCRKVHRLLGAFLSPLAVYDAFLCSIDMQCTMLFVCFPCFVLSYLQSIHEFRVPMLRSAASTGWV